MLDGSLRGKAVRYLLGKDMGVGLEEWNKEGMSVGVGFGFLKAK